MTMALPADQAPRAPDRALRILLMLLSALLTLGALEAHLPGFLATLSLFGAHVTPMKGPLAALVPAAALLLALTGRVRSAIVALGAFMLLAWAIELPELESRRRKLAGGEIGLVPFLLTFIYPAIAVAAIGLALRNRLLGLAFAFVATPTLMYWLVMGPFLIAMLIAGSAAP